MAVLSLSQTHAFRTACAPDLGRHRRTGSGNLGGYRTPDSGPRDADDPCAPDLGKHGGVGTRGAHTRTRPARECQGAPQVLGRLLSLPPSRQRVPFVGRRARGRARGRALSAAPGRRGHDAADEVVSPRGRRRPRPPTRRTRALARTKGRGTEGRNRPRGPIWMRPRRQHAQQTTGKSRFRDHCTRYLESISRPLDNV